MVMAEGPAMEPLVRRSDVRRMLSRLASLYGIPEASFMGHAAAALPALALPHKVPELDDELPRTSRSGRRAPIATITREAFHEDPGAAWDRVTPDSPLAVVDEHGKVRSVMTALRDTDPAPPPVAEAPRGDAATVHDIRDRLGLVDPEATPIPDGAA